jgi:glycosyltransferase involved in cell wall biosynthesis
MDRNNNEPARPHVIIATPAYNEEKYIGGIVLLAKQYADEVIVVDDGSHDRTARIAELAGASVVRHEKNQGYGSTIQSIFTEAKKRNPDVLVILDADSQHNPDEIPSLVSEINKGSDVAIGSRVMQDNVIPLYRRIGQKFLSRLTSIASRQRISDTESGFRAYSKKAIRELELKENGMAISSEIVSDATKKDLVIAEVPISVTYTKDSSTLNPLQHGLSLLNRIIVMISERRPLLVFGAVGTICIIFGIVVGIIVIMTFQAHQILQVGSALVSMLLITIGVLSISTGLILGVLVRRISRQL